MVRGRPLRPAADRPDPGPARRAARARRAHHAHLHRRVPRHRALRRPGRAAPRSARGPARGRGGRADRRRARARHPAWAALRAPDPRDLAAIVAARSPELRFMPEAFDRLGREYPWTRDGLSLTERRLLAAVAEGAATAGEAFVRGAARESRPYLGDTWAFAAIERLARAEVPLLDGGRGRRRSARRRGADRCGPRRARRRRGPRASQRDRSVDRGRAPGGPRCAVAVGRGSRGDRVVRWRLTALRGQLHIEGKE